MTQPTGSQLSMASISRPILNSNPVHVNDFPPEIFGEIFSLCVLLQDSSAISHHTAPLNLTWVCRSWRDFALCSPTLWTNLAVGESRGTVPNPDKIEDSIQHWGRCAGDLPLNLKYNFPNQYYFSRLLLPAALFPFSSMVRNLELTLQTYQYVPLLDALPSLSLPLLESVKLTWYETLYSWDAQGHREFAVNLSRCSLLQHAVIERHLMPNYPRPTIPVSFRLPWAQLKTLKLIDPYLQTSQAAEILVQGINLVECDLSIGEDSFTVYLMGPPPAVTLPRLESLTLRVTAPVKYHNGGAISQVLATITLPNLTALTLDNGNLTTPTLPEALCELQQRSQFLLEHFSVSGDMCIEGLRPLFQGVPTLRSLFVDLRVEHQQKYTVQLTSILMWSEQQMDYLLPDLVSLEISKPGVTVLNDYYVNQMLTTPGSTMVSYFNIHPSGNELFAALRSRFWCAGASPGGQIGIHPLKRVVLRTKYTRSYEGKGYGQEWINDDECASAIASELVADGLALELPVDFVEHVAW
ncbi:hypothetical protein Hypma_004595 [Hypsizygus marmoreus]|uniref:Uncharacterized protein n=1 Tax=Hypsizygus marmoreus TaxID=39966 RepID=A0A369K8B0_HYPMA|nr:hypothetical protein Hypma_004595 [Hypsizygus marmoreus]